MEQLQPRSASPDVPVKLPEFQGVMPVEGIPLKEFRLRRGE